MKTQYDLPTAVTFLMVGLGAGAVLAVLMMPRRSFAATYPALRRQASG